jgi:hypothetical protein
MTQIPDKGKPSEECSQVFYEIIAYKHGPLWYQSSLMILFRKKFIVLRKMNLFEQKHYYLCVLIICFSSWKIQN